MQARRTFAHGPEGGWSAIALHLEPAEHGKEGFYLTLYPDGRPPAVVFLRGPQVSHLLDLASSSATTDQAIWEYVAKIPLEPLLPSRTLAIRLRALLVDCAGAIRDQVRLQAERRPPSAPLDPVEATEPAESLPLADASEAEPTVVTPPKPPWQLP
jgi:hypothetical protein